jgi:hypothetical protein
MFIILNGMFVTANAWWPLNILFMLLLVVSLTYLIDRGGAALVDVCVRAPSKSVPSTTHNRDVPEGVAP